ncbi:MAG: GntR family transcriptional regulator [Victivallales bacterium]
MKEYKYNIVAKNIAEEILPKLQLNDLLPTSTELCTRYDISEITINKALKILVERGFVKRIQSKGTILVKYPESLWESQPVQQVHLSVLGIPTQSWNFMAAFEHFLDRFCALNPHVSYQVNHCFPNEYPERIKNEKFDLILVNIWTLRELLTTPSLVKCFLPIDKIPGLIYDEKTYFPGVLKWCRNGERLFCLPVTNSTIFQKTNLDYLGMSKTPFNQETSWDNFVNVLRTAKKNNSLKSPLFYMRHENHYWPVMLKILGGYIFSRDGKKCLLDSSELITAVKKLYELVADERLFVSSTSNENSEGQKNTIDWFKAGTLACSWDSGLFLENSYDFNCSYDPLPYGKHKANHLMIEGVMIDGSTAHRETVRDVLNFLQTAGSLEFFRHCTGVSSQKYFARTYIDKLKPTHQGIQTILDSLNCAEPIIPAPRLNVCNYIAQKLNMILLGIIPLEKACREIAAEANLMLEKEEF